MKNNYQRPRSLDALFIIDGIEGYGIRRFLLSIIDKQARAERTIGFLAISDGEMVRNLEAQGHWVACLMRPHMLGVQSPSFVKKIPQYIKHWVRQRIAKRLAIAALAGISIRTIHIGKPNVLELAISLSKVHPRSKVVWMMHNALNPTYPWRINARVIGAKCRRHGVIVLANSAFTASTIEPFAAPVQVVHLGISPDWAARGSAARHELHPSSWSRDDLVFGIFARLDPKKGHVELLRALARLQNAVSWRLLIVGGPFPGRIAERLQHEARALGIEDRIHFTGPVVDVRPYYDAVDIAVNARVDPEPFGYSVIEAILMRKPIVAVGLGGVVEIYKATNFGWLSNSGTPEDLLRTIREALRHRATWKSIAEAARERLIEKFSESTMQEKYWRASSGMHSTSVR